MSLNNCLSMMFLESPLVARICSSRPGLRMYEWLFLSGKM